MKTHQEVKSKIQELEKAYKHVLTGSVATVQSNAPRALEQVIAGSKLQALHWVLGTKHKSKLRGLNT